MDSESSSLRKADYAAADNVSSTCGSWSDLIVPWFMIDYAEKDGRLTFKVRVVPRASRSEIVGEHDGALRVRVAAPPVEGAANDELVRTLSEGLKVSRSGIEIVSGHTSKLKTVSVTGIAPIALHKLCE